MTDAVVFGRLAAFGRALASIREPAKLAPRLAAALREGFGPGGVIIALRAGERASLVPVHSEPVDLETRFAALESALTGSRQDTEETGTWLATPLIASGWALGAVGIWLPGRQATPADVALLEAYACAAALALESLRHDAAHEEARRAWERMVDAVPFALCLVDGRGRARRANRAFAALVKAPTTAIAGRPWLTLVPPAWGEGLASVLSAQGSGREVQLRAGPRTFGVSAYPIGAAGSGDAVLVFDDQTDRRRLQEQLIQSEKMSAIGQLIAGVAHDLNNPLASVVGFADFLLEGRNVPPHLEEPIRVIQQEAERAANIVRNLLSFARKQDHRRNPTPLAPLLETTFALLRNQMVSNRVEALLDVEADLPAIDVDANQIQQVFVNLINNAAQAIASGGRPGRVIVRARRWRDGVAVEVTDDGPGMPPAIAAQVFEPFFTTKAEGMGTGLGLSICQGIVKEHGGRILLSTAEGQGATFTVELPRSSRPPAERVSDPGRVPTPQLRILVVDDEPHILHYMRATLEAWGHTVDVASDGQTGLDRAAQGDFDLIISDLRMPRLNGREFFEELGRRNPEAAARMVFSTGDTVHGDTLAFLERQAHPYLHKPFSLAELRQLLARVARGSAPAIGTGE
jgi:two-component system NtrC family sensor kinase